MKTKVSLKRAVERQRMVKEAMRKEIEKQVKERKKATP